MTDRDVKKWYYAYLPTGIASGGAGPVMPLFVTEVLGGNVAQVGVVSSVGALSAIPSSALWGELSDRYARRKIFIVLGFGGLALTFFLIAISVTIGQYFILVCLLSIFGLASTTVGIALVIDQTTQTERPEKIGVFSKIGSVGAVLGFAIGFLWLQLITVGISKSIAIRLLFGIAALLAMVATIFALRFVEEPPRIHRRKKGEFPQIHLRPVEKHWRFHTRVGHFFRIGHFAHIRKFGVTISHEFAAYLFVVFIYFTGFLTFFVAFPVFLKNAGFSEAEIFLSYLVNGIAITLTYGKAGKLAGHIEPRKLAAWAIASRAVLFPLCAIIPILNTDHIVVLMSLITLHGLIGCSWAVIAVSGFTIASQLAPEGAKGEAMGFYNAITELGAVFGALLGGFLAYSFGFPTAFCVAAVLILCGAIWLRKRRR